MKKPKLKDQIESELQILGCRKVTVKEFPQSARWGSKYTAWTAISQRPGVFLFIGPAGAVREGGSPSTSFANEELRKRLLARASIRAAIGAKTKPREASLSEILDLVKKS